MSLSPGWERIPRRRTDCAQGSWELVAGQVHLPLKDGAVLTECRRVVAGQVHLPLKDGAVLTECRRVVAGQVHLPLKDGAVLSECRRVLGQVFRAALNWSINWLWSADMMNKNSSMGSKDIASHLQASPEAGRNVAE